MKGEVKERGMIFNDEMVRAILEGRKTQTRRIMKNQPAEVGPEAPVMVREIGAGFQWYGADGVSSVFNCPFGIVGDRIWVRETWAILGNEDGCSVDWNDNLCRGDEKNAARIYRASCEQKPGDYGLWSITAMVIALISIALMFTRWKKPKKPGIVGEISISLFVPIVWMQWLCGTLIASTSLQKA